MDEWMKSEILDKARRYGDGREKDKKWVSLMQRLILLRRKTKLAGTSQPIRP